MREQDRIRQFGAEVDRLMRGEELHPIAHPDDERLLEVARALAEIDLSGESQQLGAIRQRLVGMATGMERGQAAYDSDQPRAVGATSQRSRHKTNERVEPMRKSSLVAIFSIGVVTLAVLAFVGLVFVLPLKRSGEAGSLPTPTPTELLTEVPAEVPTETLFASTGTVPQYFSPLLPTPLSKRAFNFFDEELTMPGVRFVLSNRGDDYGPPWIGSGTVLGYRFVLHNQDDDRFFEVTQRATSMSGMLPQGEIVQIGSVDGVLQTGLSGSATFEHQNDITNTAYEHSIDYTNGVGLTWDAPAGTRVEIVSNLPQEDVLSFAEKLAVTFVPYRTTYLPPSFYAGRSVVAVENGQVITEDRHYDNEQFVILVQRPATETSPLPEGQPVSIGGQPGILIDGIGGAAHIADAVAFQDGVERTLIGGGGGGGGGCKADGDCSSGVPESEQNPPGTISFSNGRRLVWVSGGVLIDMLSNLPQDDLLKVAEQLKAIPPTVPVVDLSTFDWWWPAYIPSGLDFIYPTEDGQDIPGVLYANFQVSDRFVRLTQRAAMPVEDMPDGEAIMINGQPAVLNTISGTLMPPEYLDQEPVAYSDAVLITWIVDGKWMRMMTNVSREEAIRIAESMAPAG